jgi:nucleoside-triphosphatase
MKNILITGVPGSGRTTIIKRICVVFKEFNPVGFVTAEIKEEGVKVGVEAANLFGDSRVFAHIKLKSKIVVGRFKVDVKGFDDFLEKTFSREKKTGLYVIDEINKMECSSNKFSKILTDLLNSSKPVIATIADKGTGLIADVKKREDVHLFEITEQNREIKLKELILAVRDLLLE